MLLRAYLSVRVELVLGSTTLEPLVGFLSKTGTADVVHEVACHSQLLSPSGYVVVVAVGGGCPPFLGSSGNLRANSGRLSTILASSLNLSLDLLKALSLSILLGLTTRLDFFLLVSRCL